MDISKITRVRGMKKRAVYMYLAMCLALALSVTGCSKKTVSSDGVRTVEKDYTKGQIMVVAATERNRYQNIYTSQLWSVKADDSGATFEEKLLGQIEQFLIELGTTNLMADEQGIELTGQEKDSLKALAKEYYRGLSEQDRDYMGVTESEVYDLYCEYYRADKLVAELTRDENLEVRYNRSCWIPGNALRISCPRYSRKMPTLPTLRPEVQGMCRLTIPWNGAVTWISGRKLHLHLNRMKSVISLNRMENITSLSVPMLMTRKLLQREKACWLRKKRRRHFLPFMNLL